MLFRLANVSYAYEDGSQGLAAVDLEIDRGANLAILGANGSGKSTLLRILDGLIFAETGEVTFDGQVIDRRSLNSPTVVSALRSAVGFVFQNADAQLFNPTVWEELAFGVRQLGLVEEAVAPRVAETLTFLGIPHLAERPPFRLSGGEKRKVAIASVLCMNPEVLLFDEPFLGLDPRSQSWLLETLQHLQAVGKTTIIATHSLGIVPEVAASVAVLSEDHRLLCVADTDSGLRDDALLRAANLI